MVLNPLSETILHIKCWGENSNLENLGVAVNDESVFEILANKVSNKHILSMIYKPIYPQETH